MRAWAVVENGRPLQEMEWPTPEPRGAEILLEVSHCGVCHSDLHIWEGYYDLGGGRKMSLSDRGVTLPLAMGHEITGRVAKVGPDVQGVRPGDMRLVYPWIGCGTCQRCLAGEDNMCETPNFVGIHRNGGYATHVLVPHERYLVDFGDLDPAIAATYACSGLTVYGAIQKVMPLPPDEPLVVIGAGGLGLNAIGILKAYGHKRVVVVDISEEKRQAALSAGATEVVDGAGEGVAERILTACDGPVLAVIDLVNGSATARFALDALRKGGKLVQVGLFGGELTLALPVMVMRALHVMGSYIGTPQDLRDLVNMAREGLLPPLPLTTIPQREANHALECLHHGKVTGRFVLKAEPA
jgi:alcohol dehydrogenase, propanol-preferring